MKLWTANLGRAVFEPKEPSVAGAGALELMTYFNNPGPLTQVRKQLQDAAYRVIASKGAP